MPLLCKIHCKASARVLKIFGADRNPNGRARSIYFLPFLHPQQASVIRVHWHNTIGTLYVDFCQVSSRIHGHHPLHRLRHRRVLERAQLRLNTIIHASTLRVGQIQDQAELTWLMGLRNRPETANVYGRRSATCKWACYRRTSFARYLSMTSGFW